MQRSTRRRTIDRPNELAMLGGDTVGIAICDSRLEALAQRLDRGAVTQVLVPLALLGADALALLLDVRHSRKCPLSRAARW